MLRLSTLRLSLAIAATCWSSAGAATLFVDAGLTTGANDGSSWASAFQGTLGLQNALAAAGSGDQVFVKEGTYLPTTGVSRTASFQLKNGVDVLGGFNGTEVTPADRPAFGAAPTILSGDLAGNGSGPGAFNDNSFHVVRTVGTNSTAVLEGFTVTGGAATSGGGNNDRGGGILCLGNVSPTIRQCRFIQNRSTFGGAAGYVNNGGSPSFTDCSFEDGVGGSFGGAFDIAGGTGVRFERCLFRGNTASRGGALEIFASTGPIVSNCVFVNNAATGGSGGGGLWIGQNGNTRIRSCTIVGNFATNQANAGLRIQNAANVTVRNTILWGNDGSTASTVNSNINPGSNVAYSFVGGALYTGTGNVTGDPLFADVAGENFSLTADSAAIDAGSNPASVAGVTVDYNMDDRFIDVANVTDSGVGPAPIIDIGAFERGDSPVVNLGNALAGANGAPLLDLSGSLVGGEPSLVTLSNAAPATTAFLIAGLTSINLPTLGGTLVPNPDILIGLPTGTGSFAFGIPWPAGLPTGTQIFIQVWVNDASGPFGVTASNAVVGTTP